MDDGGRRPFFAIVWRRGPAWASGKGIVEQDLAEHRAYFADLHRRGRVLAAGPFIDRDAGGVAIIQADDLGDAQEIADRDSAVVDGVFSATVRPFHLVFGPR